MPELSLWGRLFCRTDADKLAASLTSEMQMLETALADQIDQQVALRCEKLQLSYQRLVIAQQLVDSWLARSEQLTLLAEQGDRRPEMEAEVRAGVLAARAVETERRLEARLAEIDLAEAIGGLSQRCCDGDAWLVTGPE